MRHLFVTDLDGTLLDGCSRVSARAADIITSLSRTGALITVATARTPATVEPLLRDTLTTPPAIVMTGAAMWHRDTLSYSHAHRLDPATALDITEECERSGIYPFIYISAPGGRLDVLHSGPLTESDRKFVDDRRNLTLKKFYLHTRYDGSEPPFIIFAMGPRDAVFSLADRLKKRHDCSVSAYVDIFGIETGIIEIFAPGVSKASAVTRLREMTGADRVTVYGDNLNDLPMMAVADESVAVDNALPEVKAAATRVIPANLTDAVPLDIAAVLSKV